MSFILQAFPGIALAWVTVSVLTLIALAAPGFIFGAWGQLKQMFAQQCGGALRTWKPTRPEQ